MKNRIRRISERDGFESSSGPTTRCHSIVEEGRAARRAHPARKTRTEILQRAPSSLGATLFGLLLLGGALLSSLAVALDTEGAVGPAWLRGGLITGALTVTWHLASRLAGQMHVHSCIPHRSFLPQFASVQATESRAHHTGFPVTSMLILAMVTCGSLYALPFMLGAPPPSDDHPLVGLMTVVTWSLSLVLVVQLVGRDRASARSASTLLTARTKLPPGWHVASGRISDSTTRTVCYAIGTEGPRTFARSSERYDTPATLELVTSDGPFVVQLEGCSLAMSRWHRADPAGTCTDDGRTWDDSLIYTARPDMNALVAGHLDEATGTFRARGPESLLVFISERGEARRVLARQLALHHACWIAPSLGIIYTMLTLGAR